MKLAPILAMITAFIVALFLWSVGSYNSAVLIGALGLMLGVVAIIVKQADL